MTAPFVVLLHKELQVEARGRTMLTSGLLIALVIIALAGFTWAFDSRGEDLAPGVLWIAAAFASMLTLGRSLHRERDRGTWEALALLPVDAGTVYLAKVAAGSLVLLIITLVAWPLFTLFFDTPTPTAWTSVLISLLLGIIGLASSGTLAAAASAHGRTRDLLVPALHFPFLVPLLMMGVQSLERALDGATVSQLAPELGLLVAMDAIFLATGWLVFGHLLGE